MKKMRFFIMVLFLLGLSQTSMAQRRMPIFDIVSYSIPNFFGQGVDSYGNKYYGFYDDKGTPFLGLRYHPNIYSSTYEVPKESDVILDFVDYIWDDNIYGDYKLYNTYRQSAYYNAPLPVKVCLASFSDEALTSISFHENIKEIRGHFGAPNLKEIRYFPGTILKYVDFRNSQLKYLTIFDEHLLDDFCTTAFYYMGGLRKFEDKEHWQGEYWCWTDVEPRSCLEYIVSFLNTPAPRSFYGVHTGYVYASGGQYVEPYDNDTLCIFGKDLSELDLYVPEGSIELYRQTANWNKFRNIYPLTEEMKQRYDEVMATLQVTEATKTNSNEVKQWYTVNSQALQSPKRGINIAVMSDGTVKKVIRK